MVLPASAGACPAIMVHRARDEANTVRYWLLADGLSREPASTAPYSRLVIDGWHMQDHSAMLTGDEAAQLVRDRVGQGQMTTWFESRQGRVLAVVSNGTRALVMLIDEPGDAGEHAIDPAGVGEQDGYILENGQHDTYDNRDTIELADALVIVKHIVNLGKPPAGAAWHVDRRGE
jgi:hypothetical protein